MKQGDIYLINLDPVIGTEIGKKRPGLIISINVMNDNSPRIIVVPISSNIEKVYPFEVLISSISSGLKQDSKAMTDQIRSIDKNRLIKPVGTVDSDTLNKVCSIAKRLISC